MATADSKMPSRELSSKSAYTALLLALPLLVIFSLMGRWQTGIGAWICAGIVVLVVRSHWDLRGSPWFWLTIGFAILLQVPVVKLVPWDHRGLTGPSLLPLAALDYYLMYGCLKLVEKRVERQPAK